jgi:hypothetical protein
MHPHRLDRVVELAGLVIGIATLAITERQGASDRHSDSGQSALAIRLRSS